MSTFLHVALQHCSVSENQHIEDGLAGAIKGPVEIEVTAGLFAAAVLAVNVAMEPGDQQVQAGPDGAARGAECSTEQKHDQTCSNRYNIILNSRHRDELGSG